MCGIAGIVDWSGKNKIDIDVLEMLNHLEHRGPDAKGVFIHPSLPFAIGSTRLSIRDFSSNANMPMQLGNDCLVYNGEIYNVDALIKAMPEELVFETSSDTEVLLHYLNQKSVSGLSDIDGMYAFAWFDSENNKLIIARDRIGIKPIYYLQTIDFLCFASEIKSIHAILKDRLSVSDKAFSDLLDRGYNFGESTLFNEIKVLTNGAYLEVDLTNQTVKKIPFDKILNFFNYKKYSSNSYSTSDYFSNLKTDLRNSVKRHCISDAPMGVVCSGGIDSSLISILTAECISAQPLFHAEIEGKTNELKYAQQIADYLNTPLYKVAVNRNNFIKNWASVIYFGDLPSYHPNDVPFYLVCKLAKEQGIKVLLSGEGADELFGGYMVNQEINKKIEWYSTISKIPNGLYKKLQKLLLPAIVQQNQESFEALSVLGVNSPKRIQDTLISRMILFGNGERIKNLFQIQKITSNIKDINERLTVQYILERFSSHLQTLLMRNDKMGMMASIESRVPYLDNELVKKWFSVPLEYKIKGKGQEGLKYLLKKFLLEFMPESFVYRPKIGFSVPLQDYIRIDMNIFKDGFLESQLNLSFETFHFFIQNHQDYYKYASIEIWGRLFVLNENLDSVNNMILKSQLID